MTQGDAHIGRTIDGRYAIESLLGRGGMGAVYRARHLGLDRLAAVKFLLTSQATADELERFRREARAASRIDHENVVRIFDTGTDQGISYIAMELVEGQDLRKLLEETGPLPAPRAVELTRQILAGLAAIHDAGIVHRDIKPGNLVVTRAGGRELVKIMDFGISKLREPGLTAVGSAIGTPEYMSPEQRTGDEVDHRTDLYAVGLTLHVMLTGALPADAATVGANTPSGGIPAELAPVIDKALAASPRGRFASAAEFAAALDNPDLAVTRQPATVKQSPSAKAKQATRTEPEVPTPRASRRWIAVIAIAAGLAAGVVVWKWTQRPTAPVTHPPATVAADASIDRDLEYARSSEAAGKLEIAIAAYEEAQRRAPAAPVAFKLGELYERLANKPAAARAFEQYLALAPEASDRETVRQRIAALQAVPVDAGAIDAPLVASGTKGPAGDYCKCSGRDDSEATFLCPKKGATGKCGCWKLNPNGWRARRLCSVASPSECPDTTQFPSAGVEGEACTGFDKQEERAGKYFCSVCAGQRTHSFRGKEGDVCHGYSADGVRRRGELYACTRHPEEATRTF